jgi:hypothetical protein
MHLGMGPSGNESAQPPDADPISAARNLFVDSGRIASQFRQSSADQRYSRAAASAAMDRDKRDIHSLFPSAALCAALGLLRTPQTFRRSRAAGSPGRRSMRNRQIADL